MTEAITTRTIRVKKDARYFAASNVPFNDERLSWEARGLMGYLLSKPDDWQVRMEDLENKGPAGEHKLRRMLAELRKYGYMNRVRITLKGGKFTWVTEIYEDPEQNPKAKEKTSRGFSTSGSSTRGKLPDIVSTESPSTESLERETRTLSQNDFYGMTVKDAQTIPELQTFREATQTWPPVGQWWLIYERVLADRLTVAQIRAVYEQWCGRGYNPANIDYLLYAKEGKIPDRKKKVTYGNSSANWTSEPAPQYTAADREIAERIKRKRAAAPAPV